jgi:hypothetical protein
MAATVLPKPGSEFGPCAEPCQHTDCAETRRQAATICDLCPEPIGYDRRFYQKDSWTVLTHQICLLRKIEREKAEARA